MHQFIAALFGLGLCLVLVLRVLTLHAGFRAWAIRQRNRLGRWLLERLDPPDEVDELAAELAQAARLDRLRFDVRRLQRILVSDMSMSATRQMGNRLAYDWLVRELDRVTRETPWSIIDDRLESDAVAPSRTRDLVRSSYVPRGPQVEVLEIGWRR